MKKILLLSLMSIVSLNADSKVVFEKYIDKSRCSSIVNKTLYMTCYSNSHKASISGWTTIHGTHVKKNNTKKLLDYYIEESIEKEYRPNYEAIKSSKVYEPAFLAVSREDMDYSNHSLKKVYSFANVIYLHKSGASKQWKNIEQYGRGLAQEMGSVNMITLAKYQDTQTVANKPKIPHTLYRVFFNNTHEFEKCYKMMNKPNLYAKSINDFEVDCEKI